MTKLLALVSLVGQYPELLPALRPAILAELGVDWVSSSDLYTVRTAGKLEAIKAYKARVNCSLPDAKGAIESAMQGAYGTTSLPEGFHTVATLFPQS